jgi:hypothetical protein
MLNLKTDNSELKKIKQNEVLLLSFGISQPFACPVLFNQNNFQSIYLFHCFFDI